MTVTYRMGSECLDKEDEVKKLLETEDHLDKPESQLPSINIQRAMMFIVLFLQLCSICADTLLFPLFPTTALDKGLTALDIGFVFSSFDFSRFLFCPVFGSLVSMNYFSCF